MAGTAYPQSVTLNLASLGTSLISFAGSGGSVSFTPDSGAGHYDFSIGSSNLAGLVGLKGTIGGVYAIGSVTPYGPGQQAVVSGAGAFSIYDGVSSSLTGTVSWDTAATVGTAGALNVSDAPNLSGLSYSGSNSALLELVRDSSAIATVSFQFLPAESLSQLATGGKPESTSYSGSLSAIPEPPASAAIIGFAAFAGVLLGFQAKRARA
jgi:hypothetical protein